MVGEFGDYFLVADAACFELTTGNEIVTVQEFGHIGLLKMNSHLRQIQREPLIEHQKNRFVQIFIGVLKNALNPAQPSH